MTAIAAKPNINIKVLKTKTILFLVLECPIISKEAT
jgi:hypothetical protein